MPILSVKCVIFQTVLKSKLIYYLTFGILFFKYSDYDKDSLRKLAKCQLDILDLKQLPFDFQACNFIFTCKNHFHFRFPKPIFYKNKYIIILFCSMTRYYLNWHVGKTHKHLLKIPSSAISSIFTLIINLLSLYFSVTET